LDKIYDADDDVDNVDELLLMMTVVTAVG